MDAAEAPRPDAEIDVLEPRDTPAVLVEALAAKVRAVDAILSRHRGASGVWDVLARMGGLEIAALTGVVLGCAARR